MFLLLSNDYNAITLSGNRSEELDFAQPLLSCTTVLDKVPSNKDFHYNQGRNQTIIPPNFSKTYAILRYNIKLQSLCAHSQPENTSC